MMLGKKQKPTLACLRGKGRLSYKGCFPDTWGEDQSGVSKGPEGDIESPYIFLSPFHSLFRVASLLEGAAAKKSRPY